MSLRRGHHEDAVPRHQACSLSFTPAVQSFFKSVGTDIGVQPLRARSWRYIGQADAVSMLVGSLSEYAGPFSRRSETAISRSASRAGLAGASALKPDVLVSRRHAQE